MVPPPPNFPIGYKGQLYFLWCPGLNCRGTFWHESRHAKCPTCGYQTYEMYMSVCKHCSFESLLPADLVRHEKNCWKRPDASATPPRHPLSQRFHAILNELANLHDMKQADYGRDSDPFANIRGSEDFGIKPWVGAMVRANDKVRRIQKVACGGELANEGVIDSFNDLAVYAVIARVLWEESNEHKLTKLGPLPGSILEVPNV